MTETVDPHAEAAEAIPFLRGAVAGVTSQVLILGAGFLAVVLVARSAGAEQLGSYAVAAALAGFVSLVSGLQLFNQVARASTDAEASAYVALAPVAGLLGAGLTLVLAASAALLDHSWHQPLLWLVPAVAIQPSIDAVGGLLARAGRPLGLALTQSARSVLRPVLVLLVLPFTHPLTGPTIAAVDSAVAVGTLLLMLAVVGRGRLRALVATRDRLRLRATLPAVGAFLLVAAGWQTIQRTDLVCVGLFLGDDRAGRYQVALRLAEVGISLFGGLMMLALPMLSRTREARSQRAAYRRATVLGATVLLPLLALIGLWGDRIATRVFGEQFALPTAVYAVLALGIAVQVAAGPNGYVLSAARRHGSLAGIAVAVLLANLTLNVVLIPLLGLLGAALASTVSLAGLNLAYSVLMQREIGRISWRGAVLRWEAGYLALLVTALGLPRLALGASPASLAVAVGLAALVVLAAARHRPVRPVLRETWSSVRPPSADRIAT